MQPVFQKLNIRTISAVWRKKSIKPNCNSSFQPQLHASTGAAPRPQTQTECHLTPRFVTSPRNRTAAATARTRVRSITSMVFVLGPHSHQTARRRRRHVTASENALPRVSTLSPRRVITGQKRQRRRQPKGGQRVGGHVLSGSVRCELVSRW